MLKTKFLAASFTAIQGKSKGDEGNTSRCLSSVMAAGIDEGLNGYVTLTKLSSMTMTCTRTIKMLVYWGVLALDSSRIQRLQNDKILK